MNLRESLYLRYFFLFPDSGLYLLKSFDSFTLIFFSWRDSEKKQFDPYWLKIAPIWFAFRANLSTSVIHRDAPGTHWNRSPNVVSCDRWLRCRLVGGIWEPGLIQALFMLLSTDFWVSWERSSFRIGVYLESCVNAEFCGDVEFCVDVKSTMKNRHYFFDELDNIS